MLQVFKSESSDTDQHLNKELNEKKIEGNFNSDNDSANLPDSSENSKQILTSSDCFTQDPCSSKGKINIKLIKRNFKDKSFL